MSGAWRKRAASGKVKMLIYSWKSSNFLTELKKCFMLKLAIKNLEVNRKQGERRKMELMRRKQDL